MGEFEYQKCVCPKCDGSIEYPAEGEGTLVSCPHCLQSITLQASPVEPQGAKSAGNLVEILAAFNRPIKPARISFWYQVGLMVVALMMVTLPIIYVGLIGFAIAGVWFYATHFLGLLSSAAGGIHLYLVKIMLYVGPLFAGSVMVFFMIKPLFARRAPRAQPLALNPANEPYLFAFIGKICDSVGAPMPTRIDLDCHFNASAGFRRGTLSFFGSDLVLTIGLPLVAGLNLAQLASLVAHEFGHFTQGSAMRLSYLIRSVNNWFVRVVYERDAWDVALANWAAEEHDWRIALVIGLARLGVWFSRRILQALMLVGYLASCFLERQMEHHADRCAIHLVGSEIFETMIRRACVLEAVLGATYEEIGTRWNKTRRLPANFPGYLLQMDHCLAPESRAKLELAMGLRSANALNTHPSDADRIGRARRAQEPGLFHSEWPAMSLFANFEVISRQVTFLHYTDDLGLGITMGMLDELPARPTS